eukprot:SAG31_NODE_5042_length_2781_cov_1.423192_2_plen_158_part_00
MKQLCDPNIIRRWHLPSRCAARQRAWSTAEIECPQKESVNRHIGRQHASFKSKKVKDLKGRYHHGQHHRQQTEPQTEPRITRKYAVTTAEAIDRRLEHTASCEQLIADNERCRLLDEELDRLRDIVKSQATEISCLAAISAEIQKSLQPMQPIQQPT